MLKQLRTEAKYLDVRGYSTMNKTELLSLIREINTKSTQTEFKKCDKCFVRNLHDKFVIYEKKRRLVSINDDLLLDVDTGGILTKISDSDFRLYNK